VDPLPRTGISQWGEELLLGPVVATAVYLDSRGARALAGLDGLDWEALSGRVLAREARRVSLVVPHDSVILLPRKWNSLYSKLHDRPRILNWAYRTALSAILTRYAGCVSVAFDHRCPAFAVLETELPGGSGPPLAYRGVRTPDLACAAAGIVARAAFVSARDELARELGERLPESIEDAAILLKRLHGAGGAQALLAVAKRDHPAARALLEK
jgi:ribonuclease HIII